MGFKIQNDVVVYDDKTIKVASANTSSRPASPEEGMIRFNNEENAFEGYDGSVWGPLGGSSLPDLYTENYVSASLYDPPSATGVNSVAIGDSAIASGDRSVALGPWGYASGSSSFAFGTAINNGTYGAKGSYSIAIGRLATSEPNYGVAIGSDVNGNGAKVGTSGSGGVALGGAYANGYNSFAAAIASNSASYGATGNNSVAIGQLAKATAANSIAIGDSALSTVANLIALGGTTDTVQISGVYTLPTTDGTNGQVLTTNGAGVVTFADAGGGGGVDLELYTENPVTPTAPSATGTNAVAIGSGASADGTDAIAIGTGADASTYSVSIGTGADTGGSPNTVAIGRIGTVNYSPQSVIIGMSASTAAYTNTQTALGYNAKTNAEGAVAFQESYASGADSFAAAITTNSSSYGATGANSVAIGYQVKASGQRSAVVGGYASTASNSYSAVYNSGVSVASGYGATVIGGLYNDAIGQYSFALGYGAQAKEIGKFARSATIFSGTSSQAQSGEMILSAVTSDATATPMTANWSTASTDNQIILPNNSAYAFHGTIVARQQASQGTACAAWKVEGLIRREGSAGTTVLVNYATTILDNTPGWGLALSADTTNGGLKIEVTGAASTNIRWVSTINTSEVTYA